ncbi:sigma-70 family RNA polymerase sigma factor [Planctomycetota bacterium]
MDKQYINAEAIMKAALKYQDALVTYAYAMLQDWASAEDAVQDALVVVMNKWQDFKPGTSIYAWVRQIVHFKTLEAIRSRQREITTEDEKLQDLVQGAMEGYLTEERADGQSSRLKALQECMSSISRGALDLITGFYRDANSYEKLAEIYGRSVEGVRKMLYRSRRQLDECTRKRLDNPEECA